MEGKKLTVVTLLLGRYEQQVVELDQRIQAFSIIQKTANLMVIADHEQWLAAPQLQMFRILNPTVPVFVCNKSSSLPVQAMNLALTKITSEYVLFSLLGDPLKERLNLLLNWWAKLSDVEKDSFKKQVLTQQVYTSLFVGPYYPSSMTEADCMDMNAYGWCQTSRIGLGLGALIVPTALLQEMDGFDENPILQTEIERWYALAVTARSHMVEIGHDTMRVRRLSEYPFSNHARIPEDLAIRYATYCQGIAARRRTHQECAQSFANDLNDADKKNYHRLTGITAHEKLNRQPYKILIIGGYWEYHHNQICFFNYLERLYGSGFGTYRTVLEYTMPPNLALEYDLVIFTRCRSKQALDIMRFCNKRHIPTIYMIDDNWISIAKDHPKEGAVFTPGNENYDNFLESLGLCKATWLYNETLREDVLPYTRCVKKFKISVDPSMFCVKKPRIRSDELLYIGFSGSLRYDDTAFRALARYARRHLNVRVILIGILSVEQEQLFKGLDTIRIGFASYSEYSKVIASLQPDLLIAPLQDTRTAHSKCYNKYIESGVIGSVCIYSKVAPYTDVVKDGVNGYFVEDETEEGWYRKLQQVLSDLPALRRVQQTVQKDVLTYHSLDVMVEPFAKKIQTIVSGEELEDD